MVGEELSQLGVPTFFLDQAELRATRLELDDDGGGLLSDGVTRLADRYHLATWDQLTAILADEGPTGLIRRVRKAESTDPYGARWPRGKICDDATAVWWPAD